MNGNGLEFKVGVLTKKQFEAGLNSYVKLTLNTIEHCQTFVTDAKNAIYLNADIFNETNFDIVIDYIQATDGYLQVLVNCLFDFDKNNFLKLKVDEIIEADLFDMSDTDLYILAGYILAYGMENMTLKEAYEMSLISYQGEFSNKGVFAQHWLEYETGQMISDEQQINTTANELFSSDYIMIENSVYGVTG